MGKVYQPIYFIYRGKRYLVMSHYYYEEYKHAINNLLTNFGFQFNREVTTIVDPEQDVVEMSQELDMPEDAIEIGYEPFHYH